MQEYSDAGNVQEVCCLNNPRITSAETLDWQDAELAWLQSTHS
jgi:hypothetical protein